MKPLLAITILWFLSISAFAQSRKVNFDVMSGINKPTGSLDVENKLGWRIGGGFRYNLKSKASINILQANYDAFTTPNSIIGEKEEENSAFSSTISFLTGYSHPVLNKLYVGANAGVGFVGHNRINKTTKFGINPMISYEPFREVYVDLGYLNFYGGYRNTKYLNFNIRYSF